MSLKSNLNQIIQDRNGGVVTLQEIEDYCHQAHYKLSNAERRLRASESPNIERVMKEGAIIGYKLSESGDIAPIINKAEAEKSFKVSPDSVPDWFSQPTIPKVVQTLF